MNTTHNGYRFADLARGESLCSPDTCDHCDRQGLKKTVKLINPDGRVVWFGVGCAATAMGCGLKEVRAAKAKAESDLEAKERAIRAARDAVDEAIWQAFLDRLAPEHTGNRFKQIEALGGWAPCRARYRAECPATVAA